LQQIRDEAHRFAIKTHRKQFNKQHFTKKQSS
jgi:excinuclease UvrABC nuclease subunit